jgi:type II secretory pathway pseudopilin PulG
MIVVAIVGILATLAVFMFTKSTARARASEVPAVFAEFRIKQEQYHLENGLYFTTGDETNIGSWFPTSPAAPSSGGNPSTPTDQPTAWTEDLRMVIDKSALYCSYVTIGRTNGQSYGSVAQATFGAPSAVQPTNFFYNIAECDLDGKTSVNSRYFSSSTTDGIIKVNDGR